MLKEKHELLSTIFEAVYVDLWANRCVVGIQAKPAFYALFQSLEQNKESKVVIFNPIGKEQEPPFISLSESTDGGFRCLV